MAISFIVTATVPMFLILTLTKNIGFEFPDLDELDAMETAEKLEVLENNIREGAKVLGWYAPTDMGFSAVNDECGCDAVCNCEIESDYVRDESWERPIYPATYNFKNPKDEDEDKDKEIKRSDVIELE